MTPSRPLPATAVLFFNKPTLTGRCVRHVREQIAADGRAHRLFLVDNGSRPGVLATELTASFAGCEVTGAALSPNQGFACGMNRALGAAFADARVDRVVLLSNDVELGTGFYASLRALEPGTEAVIWCPQVWYLTDRSKPAYTHGLLDLERFELSHAFDETRREIVFPHYYPAAVTIWTRAAFERLGGFDERYFCYWEDVELSRRSARAGVRLLSVPGLRAHHLGRGTTGGKRAYCGHFDRGRQLTMEILRKAD